MTIKEALEHKWIKMFDDNKYTESRKTNGDGEKDFEFYSSTKKLDEIQIFNIFIFHQKNKTILGNINYYYNLLSFIYYLCF